MTMLDPVFLPDWGLGLLLVGLLALGSVERLRPRLPGLAAYAMVAIAGAEFGAWLGGAAVGAPLDGMLIVDGWAVLGRLLALLAGAALFTLAAMRPAASRGTLVAVVVGVWTTTWLASAADLTVLVLAGLGLMLALVAALVFAAPGPSPGALTAASRFGLGAAGAAMLAAYGASWLYGLAGTTRLGPLAAQLNGLPAGLQAPLALGALFLVAGLLFWLGAVPWSRWFEAVFEAEDLVAVGLAATMAPLAALMGLGRWVPYALAVAQPLIEPALVWAGLVTLIGLALVSLTQTRLRRLLALGLAMHLGTLVLALVASTKGETLAGASTALGLGAVALLLGVMACLAVLARLEEAGAALDLLELRALAWRSPAMAVFWLIGWLTLAGWPLTFGFWARLASQRAVMDYALSAMALNLVWLAVAMGAVGLVMGYHGLRMARMMLARTGSDPEPLELSATGWAIALAASGGSLVLFVVPGWLWALVAQLSAGR